MKTTTNTVNAFGSAVKGSNADRMGTFAFENNNSVSPDTYCPPVGDAWHFHHTVRGIPMVAPLAQLCSRLIKLHPHLTITAVATTQYTADGHQVCSASGVAFTHPDSAIVSARVFFTHNGGRWGASRYMFLMQLPHERRGKPMPGRQCDAFHRAFAFASTGRHGAQWYSYTTISVAAAVSRLKKMVCTTTPDMVVYALREYSCIMAEGVALPNRQLQELNSSMFAGINGTGKDTLLLQYYQDSKNGKPAHFDPSSPLSVAAEAYLAKWADLNASIGENEGLVPVHILTVKGDTRVFCTTSANVEAASTLKLHVYDSAYNLPEEVINKLQVLEVTGKEARTPHSYNWGVGTLPTVGSVHTSHNAPLIGEMVCVYVPAHAAYAVTDKAAETITYER